MKKTIRTRLLYSMGLATIIFIIASCNSGAGSKKGMTDSLQAKITADSIMKADEMKNDSVKKAMLTEGIAKPNPAKKSGKGMIVFQTDWEKNYEKLYAGLPIEMDKDSIYNKTEVRPSYPGGQKALAKFIQDNIVYPQAALENGVEANVDVVFAVDEKGKVYTPMIKGDKEGYGLDQASLDVVNKMPKWNPGQIKGKNVKSYYTLPISFKIQ